MNDNNNYKYLYILNFNNTYTVYLCDFKIYFYFRIGEKIYFKDSITVPNEMVEVICTLRDTIIYKNYHIFIRPKQAVIKRVSGNVSILILGLDSVSRINFHRRMPKTNAILSQLGNIEFLGYNKIDDNTYPNLISVLSGMSAAELKKNCWLNENDYFDRCSFVWDEFKDADFGTAFVEDSPGIGLFNYLKRGFVNKPTDHYLRPLMVRAEQSIGHTSYPVGNTKVCIGDKLSFATVLDHTLKIALSMSDRLYMNFAWTTSLTHDTMEYPLCGDDELSEFLITLEKSGELNHTILIVMSDHGMRWGNFRSTYQGGLEDRLPILKFVMPEWFKSTYRRAVKNLKINSRRLTTPYDLHETLLDLVNVKQLDDDTTGRRTEEARALGNATRTSLFLEIPLNRTCSSSGIPVHYCACHNPGKTLAVNNVNAVRAADALMRQLNLMLLNFTVCANLTLLQVDSVVVETGRETNKVNDYQLQVTTLPGLAKFEATVREYHNEFSLVGSVSRLNVYGNQSYCVNDPNIKLICYCKRQKA